jgi:hypothetical protein
MLRRRVRGDPSNPFVKPNPSASNIPASRKKTPPRAPVLAAPTKGFPEPSQTLRVVFQLVRQNLYRGPPQQGRTDYNRLRDVSC